MRKFASAIGTLTGKQRRKIGQRNRRWSPVVATGKNAAASYRRKSPESSLIRGRRTITLKLKGKIVSSQLLPPIAAAGKGRSEEKPRPKLEPREEKEREEFQILFESLVRGRNRLLPKLCSRTRLLKSHDFSQPAKESQPSSAFALRTRLICARNHGLLCLGKRLNASSSLAQFAETQCPRSKSTAKLRSAIIAAGSACKDKSRPRVSPHIGGHSQCHISREGVEKMASALGIGPQEGYFNW